MSPDPFDDRASCTRESAATLLLAIAGEYGLRSQVRRELDALERAQAPS